MTKWLLPDIITSQDLSAGGGTALDYTTSINRKFELTEININFKDSNGDAVAVTETITIKINSAKGASYDTVKVKRSLVAESNFVYRPQGDAIYQAGDEIDIDITAANATGIAYVQIKAKELHQ